MIKRILLPLLFLFRIAVCKGQELYPYNEPASNIPVNVLGVREFNTSYKEQSIYRNFFGLRLMYGVLPKLSVFATVGLSNHHDKNFPPDLVTHTHNGNQTTYTTGNFKRGVVYPYLFTGVNVFAKYRFFTLDGQNSHFRIAAYGELSTANVAHDETEPNLLDDTKGFGSGFIFTALKKGFAVSLTTGVIIPGVYNGFSPDPYGGELISTRIKYGNAVKYNLSFGYLLLPFRYKSYKQTNLNLYLELMGKAYQDAIVTQYGGIVTVPIETPLLKAGNYVEAHPGLQFIFNSNTRVDLSVGFPFINKSLAHFYPLYLIGIQRYFYLGNKPVRS